MVALYEAAIDEPFRFANHAMWQQRVHTICRNRAFNAIDPKGSEGLGDGFVQGCEDDQAAMRRGIPHRNEQENAQSSVKAHHHSIARVRMCRVP